MSDWISTFPGYRQVLTTGKKVFGRIIRTGPTPNHVGIIMDGNRRYAKSHKIELKEGHSLGFESMANNLELLYESGVSCATVYAFSIENFKRSSYEVSWLMDLAKSKFRQLSQHGELCEQYGIKIRILGNTKLLPSDVQTILKETEDMTKDNDRAILNVCFPYTSRDEITHSIQQAVDRSIKDPDFIIDENTINKFLYTADSPPLDLLIRTSGAYRLSDFLLWQCVPSSCAIVFVDRLWPEFRSWDMCKILINWGFNTYWYGHGNGHATAIRNYTTPRKHYNLTKINETAGSTGFGRYEDDEDEDDDISRGNSDIVGDELETITSEEGEESEPYKKNQN